MLIRIHQDALPNPYDYLPQEMILEIFSHLSLFDLLRIATLNKTFQAIANQVLNNKFRQHFPDGFMRITDQRKINWSREFRDAYEKEYGRLNIKQKKLFTYVKESNLASLRDLYDNNDLELVDASNMTLLDWACKYQYQEILDFFYRQKCNSFLLGQQLNLAQVDEQGRTLLHYAAACKQTAELKNLLTQDIDVNVQCSAKSCFNWTPLHVAAHVGHDEIVCILLNHPNILVNNKTSINSSPLHLAAQNGHIRIVELLLAQDAINVNARDMFLRTPLQWAACNGHIQVVELLLARTEININAKNIFKNTPFHLAAQRGHTKVVELLLTRDEIEINASDCSKDTSLHMAARNGHADVVELLLARTEIDINARNSHQLTPLHLAAENGHIKIVELLLARTKTDINASNPCGILPLHLAAENGHADVVEFLLARTKDDINARNNDRNFPLHLAAQNGHADVVELLLARTEIDINARNDEGNSPIHLATRNKHIRVIELLLAQSKIEINVKDSRKDNPLHLAIENGDANIVALLLARAEIEINAGGFKKETPLHLAALNGREDIVKLLLARDEININAIDAFNNTPFHLAAQNGHAEVIKLLLARTEIEINARNNDGNLPLHLATRNKHIRVIELLLTQSKIEINARNNDGNSPLHLAAQNGHIRIVKLLLVQSKIEINFKDKFENTPLHLAAQNGHSEVVEFLLAQGKIKINAKSDTVNTPLHLAAENGHSEVVKILLAQGKIKICIENTRRNIPLLLAAKYSHDQILQMLVKKHLALKQDELILHLAQSYEQGSKDIAKNPEQAHYLYTILAELGNKQAKQNLQQHAMLKYNKEIDLSEIRELKELRYLKELNDNKNDLQLTFFLAQKQKLQALQQICTYHICVNEIALFKLIGTIQTILEKSEAKFADEQFAAVKAAMPFSSGIELVKGIKNEDLPLLQKIACNLFEQSLAYQSGEAENFLNMLAPLVDEEYDSFWAKEECLDLRIQLKNILENTEISQLDQLLAIKELSAKLLKEKSSISFFSRKSSVAAKSLVQVLFRLDTKALASIKEQQSSCIHTRNEEDLLKLLRTIAENTAYNSMWDINQFSDTINEIRKILNGEEKLEDISVLAKIQEFARTYLNQHRPTISRLNLLALTTPKNSPAQSLCEAIINEDAAALSQFDEEHQTTSSKYDKKNK